MRKIYGYVFDFACKGACVKFANVKSVGNLRNVRQGEVGRWHNNTLCVPNYCVGHGEVRGGEGRGGDV